MPDFETTARELLETLTAINQHLGYQFTQPLMNTTAALSKALRQAHAAGEMSGREMSGGAMASFNAKIEKVGECWRWNGTLDKDGYGRFCIGGEILNAHRWAYVAMIGPIPDGFVIDHLCRIRNCVNPKHLEPVTDKVNILRSECPAAKNARKTHCVHGHPFDEKNTRVQSDGRRYCRACKNTSSRRKLINKRIRARAAEVRGK